MPTGTCNYPGHHTGPSAALPLGWLAALGLGALMVAVWHVVVVVLAVIGTLVALGVPVLLLWHNHGSGYDPELERQAALERAQRRQAAAYSITPASSPAVASVESAAALEAAPVIHHHVHFHGVDRDEMATVARKAIEPPHDRAW